ncbi:MAG: zinc ABC transporter substrate-binding protein [Lentisphaeria bacterium]|nr:zinc ABC transporter substrate-binding protein [Lentisphaeria bacterium]
MTDRIWSRFFWHSFALTLLLLLATSCGSEKRAKTPRGVQQVLATTFPIYLITRNVVGDAADVDVQMLLPSELGCPHNYALSPQDMTKLGNCDVLVLNGLGLEEFLGAQTKRVAKRVTIIDSSSGIDNLILYPGTCQHHHHEGDGGDVADDHQADINPHLFVSPRICAQLAENIAEGLIRCHPRNAAMYRANANAYAVRMNALADDFAALGKRIKNRRIATQHSSLDYLARDMGIEIVAVIQINAGQQPSAAELIQITAKIQKHSVGAILTEPQYPPAVAETVARETGVPTIAFDPVASGPPNAPIDYAEKVMRQNLSVLKNALEGD